MCVCISSRPPVFILYIYIYITFRTCFGNSLNIYKSAAAVIVFSFSLRSTFFLKKYYFTFPRRSRTSSVITLQRIQATEFAQLIINKIDFQVSVQSVSHVTEVTQVYVVENIAYGEVNTLRGLERAFGGRTTSGWKKILKSNLS